jgi:glycosyltransferase involved in cell wall biosynthesis
MTDITVVMATYKQAKYLRRAIESIENQSINIFPKVEVVRVGSDRKTMEVLMHYETGSQLWDNINSLQRWHEVDMRGWLMDTCVKRANLWEQRQIGLCRLWHDAPKSPNNYICFFDSDDVMLPGWLDRGLKVAEEISSRGKIPIVGPSYRMVDEKLRPIQDVILPEFSMDKMMVGSIIPDFSITKTENLRVAFEAGCKTARELFTPQYSCYCTWLEMLKRFDSEVRLLPDIGFLYRQHHGGMHNRFKRSKRASRRNVEAVHRIARNYFPELGDGT